MPDGLWAIVEPLIPAQRERPQGSGTRQVNDRAVFTAIVYVLTIGRAWRHLSDVSRAAYLRVRNKHAGIAEQARRELAAIERTRLPEDTSRNAETLREWWPEATLLQRRTFLKLFIERVRVLPASSRGARFSTERAEILWMR